MRRNLSIIAMATLASLSFLPLAGCHKADDGLTSTQQNKADRLDQIAKNSGGDWNKLSQQDKDYILNTLAKGNEHTARMILMAKTGHFQGRAPVGGAPPNAAAGK